MKKSVILTAAIFTAFGVKAQGNNNPQQSMHIDKAVFDICATIFVVALFMIFILTIEK